MIIDSWHGGLIIAAATEGDPEARVVMDGVAQDGPTGSGATDADAVRAAERNDIALFCACTALRGLRVIDSRPRACPLRCAAELQLFRSRYEAAERLQPIV